MKRVGLLGFDEVAGLDLAGPLEAFASAVSDEDGKLRPCYETVILGLTGKPFVTEAGMTITPHRVLARAPELDTLIICGGRGLRKPAVNAQVSAWISARAPRIRRVASVCTGIYALAPTGLLDGRRVTTTGVSLTTWPAVFLSCALSPTPFSLKTVLSTPRRASPPALTWLWP
jgi:transcriptional regulator GlxA family with amidase domain